MNEEKVLNCDDETELITLIELAEDDELYLIPVLFSQCLYYIYMQCCFTPLWSLSWETSRYILAVVFFSVQLRLVFRMKTADFFEYISAALSTLGIYTAITYGKGNAVWTGLRHALIFLLAAGGIRTAINKLRGDPSDKDIRAIKAGILALSLCLPTPIFLWQASGGSMCRKTVTPRSGTKVLRAEELYDLSLSPGEKADLLQYIANAEARAGKEITIRVGQTDGDVELDYFLRRVTVSEETLRISAVSDLLPFVLFRCKLILDYDQMMDIDAQLCKGKQVQQEELLLASYMAEYMLGTNTADEITSADDYVQMRVDTILSLVFDETIHL